MTNECLSELRQYLSRCSPGEITDTGKAEVERLLSLCWEELTREVDDARTHAYKLHDRTQQLTWQPPLLSFDIERHGAVVRGSIYAEVHRWTINVQTAVASRGEGGRRQVASRDKPLDVSPIAQEIAAAVMNKVNDSRLKWYEDGSVRVLVSKVIPATNQQTTSARRRRFRRALEDALRPLAWLPAPGRDHWSRCQ